MHELPLQPGTYYVSTSIADRGHMYDHAMRAFELRVRGRGDEEPGLVRIHGSWTPPVSAEGLAAAGPAAAPSRDVIPETTP